MGGSSWPSESQLKGIKKIVSEMSGRGLDEVRIVVSPYRICPLGAHIDHQGGLVSAMTINKGILLGFVPSGDAGVILRSAQFKGEVRFRVDENQYSSGTDSNNKDCKEKCFSESGEENNWGNYARGAVYALLSKQNFLGQDVVIVQGIIGYIRGCDGLDSSGISSSAATGVAYLLALELANKLTVSASENIEYDRLIENGYLGLRNGILDQSAILLSTYGCLLRMDCKTKEHRLIYPSKLQKEYKILLAFSGLKQALTKNSGYNSRVIECQEAAKILLDATRKGHLEPILSNVELQAYEAHKSKLNINQAKRAEHYFSENLRVVKGLEAWALGQLDEFGKLVTASGLSSIKNYECGCEPLIQLYEILLRTPGVLGARFSGAGFRGCCLAFVEAERAAAAAAYVRMEYLKVQPQLGSQMNEETAVLICEPGHSAHLI